MAKSKPKKPSRFAPLIGWVKKLFAVRVFLYYSSAQGPLLASGLAFQAIFAVFAAVWVGFSVVGLVVAGDHDLQKPLIDFLANTVPGLIKGSSGNGAIDPKVLLSAGTFTLSGIIALVGSAGHGTRLARLGSHGHPDHLRAAAVQDELRSAETSRPRRRPRASDSP